LENFLLERRTALRRNYHALSIKGQTNAKRLAEFFSRHGQGLLPMLDLIQQSRLAVGPISGELLGCDHLLDFHAPILFWAV